MGPNQRKCWCIQHVDAGPLEGTPGQQAAGRACHRAIAKFDAGQAAGNAIRASDSNRKQWFANVRAVLTWCVRTDDASACVPSIMIHAPPTFYTYSLGVTLHMRRTDLAVRAAYAAEVLRRHGAK